MSGRETIASTELDIKSKVNKLVLEAIDKGDFEKAASLKRVLADDAQAGCGAGCPCGGGGGSGCAESRPATGGNINR